MNLKNLLVITLLFFASFIYSVNEEAILAKDFPRKISDYSFFTDGINQVPHENLLPYELISPLFSDYSYKKRFVYVPNGKAGTYKEDWVYDFPVGSALVKTFYFPVDERNLDLGNRLLETRVLLRQEDGWKAVSYAWNEEQTEAFIKIAGKTIYADWLDLTGQKKKVRYRVPNVNQCKECHSANDKITPIGPKPTNLNKPLDYKEGTFNQLSFLLSKGYIDQIDQNFRKTVDWRDESQTLDARARSYLAINCGHCHSKTGVANSTGLYLDLRENKDVHLGIFKSPVATGRGSGGLKYSIVPGKSEESILLYRMRSTDPGIMMPESGRALIHKEAVKLIEDWINDMES